MKFIKVEPALWLWAPDDERDRPWRKFQHLYWPLPFSLTFLLWRIDSVRTAFAKKLKLEVSRARDWGRALCSRLGPSFD